MLQSIGTSAWSVIAAGDVVSPAGIAYASGTMSDEPLELRVECYAGYRGEETPRRFYIGNRAIEVKEVLDRWLAPDHRYFKVLADDGGTYILRHDTETNRWALTLFDARGLKGE
jgi:hypothetical protein